MDRVGDQVEDLFDAALEGLLVAGIGVLAGTAAGKAAPVVAAQLRKAVAPKPGKTPKTGKRTRKLLPSTTPGPETGVPAMGEVIDLHPDKDGVYR